MRDWWRRALARERARVRNDGRGAVLWALRITVAAVASYVVATAFFPGTQPLLAPLTAMLVVQVTPVSLLASGVDRVVAVVSGVFLAVVFSVAVPLEWWSLGLLIFLSISIGQVLRLRSNLIEVAISGMLVLGVGSLSAESAAWQRIAETLVGAAVGIAANLLFPPKVASADAGEAIDGLADSLSELLTRSADQLETLAAEGGEVAPVARDWLDDARQITYDIPRVGAALLHAEQGRRLNVRAVGTPDVGPGLRQGLEALEHSSVAIRVMFRAILDTAWPEGPGTEAALGGLAQTLRDMAAGVDAFGQLVRDEAEAGGRLGSADVQEVGEALEGLREARARLDDLMTAGAPTELLELHAVVLSTLKRLLVEMDLDQRIRRQVRLLAPRRSRLPSSGRPNRAAPAGATPYPGDETQESDSEAETQVLPTVPRVPRSKRRP